MIILNATHCALKSISEYKLSLALNIKKTSKEHSGVERCWKSELGVGRGLDADANPIG